jgi:CheY-like chemotaxis protein
LKKEKILVVDDMPDVRATVSGLLLDAGFDVTSASSKNEALRILRADQFNVAILDIRLDDTDEDNKDGLLLMHEIKKRHPKTVTLKWCEKLYNLIQMETPLLSVFWKKQR